MMASDFIVDVNEADFEYEVLAFSQQMPVVVDFWAEWCGPCKILGPLLEKIAQEAQGEFRLAKVNVDENPNLALRYSVRGIPAVKAFRDGKLVSEFVGVQPEPRVREFLRAIAPSQSDLTLEKGNSLLQAYQAKNAEAAFRQVLSETPDRPVALLGLAKSLLLQGKGAESYLLLKNFPASREYTSAETLRPLAESLARFEKNEDLDTDNPLEAAFNNALRLIVRSNEEAAMDGLLDIIRQDKRFRNGEPRMVMLGLLELLGDENQITRQYRKELASVLF